MGELTCKFSRMMGRLRPDYPGKFVRFSDLFKPRIGANIFIKTAVQLVILLPSPSPFSATMLPEELQHYTVALIKSFNHEAMPHFL